jgi:hypothetical protein
MMTADSIAWEVRHPGSTNLLADDRPLAGARLC